MGTKEFLSIKGAREYLGVSKQKMASLIKAGAINVYEDPRDKRVKLVRQTDLELLKVPRRRDQPVPFTVVPAKESAELPGPPGVLAKGQAVSTPSRP